MRIGFGALALLVSLSPSLARAQTAQDKAAADVLFQSGKKLMLESKFAEACPKFAESHRLDAGIGTMLWLAECYERTGQTASAWAQFVDAAETAGQKKDAREKVARARAEKLEPSLVHVVIEVMPDADVEGLEVQRDGAVIRRAQWNTALPVDPGKHVISAHAPKRQAWEARITLDAERATTVRIPLLAEEAPAPAPRTVRFEAAPVPPPPAARGTTQRVIGLAVAGVGVVGVGIGASLGFAAKSKLNESNADGHCHDGNRCDAIGVATRASAKSLAAASTASLVAGAAALAGGIAIYLTAPNGFVRVVPAVGRNGGELTVMGVF